MNNHKLWVEKYRPKDLSDYIFKDPAFEEFVHTCIKNKSFPHILLSGVQGTGKTTIANILISKTGVLPEDVLEINASSSNSIETVRSDINTFATTFPMGAFKVIVLEEADRLTVDAQRALKVIMETYSDNVRFIFTTNREFKIDPALKSRMQQFSFQRSDPDDIAEYIVGILVKENVKFTLELVDQYVALGYPDIRKVVQLVSQHSGTGVLIEPRETSVGAEYQSKLLDLIKRDKWGAIRDLLCGAVGPEEWEDVYKYMYTNIHQSPAFARDGVKWDDAIIIINDHLYKHAFVADPEICASAMFSQLKLLQQQTVG